MIINMIELIHYKNEITVHCRFCDKSTSVSFHLNMFSWLEIEDKEWDKVGDNLWCGRCDPRVKTNENL